MRKVVISYVPVLHEGYRRFLEEHKDAGVFIFGKEIIERFGYLYKEIRALKPEQMKKAIESLGIVRDVRILDINELKKLTKSDLKIVMSNEDIMHELAEEYFPNKKVLFDDVFLRWDKNNTVQQKPVNPDQKISQAEFDQKMMKMVYKKARKSSDWWRRMGAIIVKDGKIVISTRNRHVPSDHTPYMDGDPRNCWHKGVHLELSTVLHAEAGAIAQAAKRGISLEGAEMYTGTFPCPPCAKQIAYSGIKKLYYREGYGVLDGEDIMKSQGVEIVFVDVDIKQEKRLGDTEYKK
ncbi:MAG: deaminase [Patescibacteria group bacterium]|nr:deaminase [Patescibacteria group bacterium]